MCTGARARSSVKAESAGPVIVIAIGNRMATAAAPRSWIIASAARVMAAARDVVSSKGFIFSSDAPVGLPYTVAVQGLLVGGGIILLLAFNVTHLYLWISMLNDLSGQLPEGLQLATRWDPFARWRF